MKPLAGLLIVAFVPLARAQESRALLDAPLVTLDYYRYGTLLDLDGDGDQDAVSWWYVSNGIQQLVLRPEINDGAGRLVPGTSWLHTVSASTHSAGIVRMRRCDFDRDGRDDWSLVVNPSDAGYGQSALFVFQSNGAAAGRSLPTYAFQGGTARVGAVVEDFDRDGTTDVAIALGSALHIYSYAPVAGGDPVGSLRATLGLPGPNDDVFVIDANGDATPDVYVNVGGQGLVVPVNPDFTFGTPITVPHGVTTMPMPVAGDVDQDGDEDLVVFGMTSYAIMRRTGPASWSLEPLVAGGPATNLCDVDGDGDLDGLCCGGGRPRGPLNLYPSTFRISINDGSGGFAPAHEMPGLGSDHMAGSADLDADGDVDIVAGRCIYYGRGPIRPPIVPAFATAAREPAGVDDVDGDGDPDFRFGLGGFHRNLAWSQFLPFAPLFPRAPAGTTNEGPGYAGDFDGDGDVDLIVGRRMSDTGIATAWLYTNNGGGGFVDAGPAAVGGDTLSSGTQLDPQQAGIADADGDGDLDVLLFVLPPQTSIRLNDGTGRFLTPPIQVPGCRVIHVADFDGDGVPDLLSGLNGPTVFPGLGGGGFGAGISCGGPPGYVFTAPSLDVGDLDGDGDLDLVSAATPTTDAPGRVGIYWNLGQFAFVREDLLDVLIDPAPLGRAANAVDLNGDGRLDLLCGAARDAYSAAHVILRRADNTGWEPAFQQAIYPEDATDPRTFPLRAKVVDVDLDGDLDLVTDRVLRSTRWHGPNRGTRIQDASSSAGSGAMRPTLNAIGPWHVGSTASIRLTGAWPRAGGLLSSGWADTQPPFAGGGGPALPLHGMRLHSVIPFTTAGTPDVAGEGSWTLTYQVPAYKAGRTYLYRAQFDDPGSPAGQVTTNAVRVTYGF